MEVFQGCNPPAEVEQAVLSCHPRFFLIFWRLKVLLRSDVSSQGSSFDRRKSVWKDFSASF